MIYETDEMWALNKLLYVLAAIAIFVIWMVL
jgi:hypothetical protein